MANINVKDLSSNITGFDLFSESENFMRDLSEYNLDLYGGWGFWDFLGRWSGGRA